MAVVVVECKGHLSLLVLPCDRISCSWGQGRCWGYFTTLSARRRKVSADTVATLLGKITVSD